MRINHSLIFFLFLGSFACKPAGKSEVSEILGIKEPKDWILVIHPEGCKTCLDSFYTDLMKLPTSSKGAIVLLAKNSKALRMSPLIENSPVPLYLDENKTLIQKGTVDPKDQILVFKENKVEKFDILNYQEVFQELEKR